MIAHTSLVKLAESLEALGWEITNDDIEPIVLTRKTFEEGNENTEISIYRDGHVSLRQTFKGFPEGIADIPPRVKGALILIWNFVNTYGDGSLAL